MIELHIESRLTSMRFVCFFRSAKNWLSVPAQLSILSHSIHPLYSQPCVAERSWKVTLNTSSRDLGFHCTL